VTIVIAKAGVPVARLAPLGRDFAPGKKGLLEGRIKINPEFDQPLPDEAVRLFEGRDPT
jgi:antitoxin (DNA-binding transcriptional repressor) of toxin-antitoxin stability system